MASSSSYRTWRFDVFVSFNRGDVRKALDSYLRRALSDKGISIAIDGEEMERGATLSPARKQTIRESRIAIVVLSFRYAASSQSLNELVDILKCKDDIGQIVIPVFYGVDQLDVQRQTGDFGDAFKETCKGKTEEERRRWSLALSLVGYIAGEESRKWDNNQADMIEKIVKDVSHKLNSTPSTDFDGMVGL